MIRSSDTGRQAHRHILKRAMLAPLVALAACLTATASVAQEPCDVVLPELADDVRTLGLPSDDSRWAAADRLWRESEQVTLANVRKLVRGGSISPAADIIQGRTHDLLREALVHGRYDLAHRLLPLWQLGLGALSPRSTVRIYYATPEQRVSDVALSRPFEMWVGPDGIEPVLYASIYLAGATDIAATIARLPAGERDGELTAFARRISDVALSQYLRWAFGPPKMWQVRGWGCDGSGMDLMEFTARRMDGSLASDRIAYCSAPTDIDMLLAIGIANLLAAADLNPSLIDISREDQERLASLLRVLDRFLASHIAFGATRDADGSLVETADLDAGVWAAHADLAFSGDEDPAFPAARPPLNPRVSWDFSHGARIAWLALTLADHSSLLDGKSDWKRVARGIAHQVSQKVLDNSGAIPRFRNYLDGSNGWYRVDLATRQGIPPFGLSRAFLGMPWARLTAYDDRLKTAAIDMWRALAIPSPAERHMLEQVYALGSYSEAGDPSGTPICGAYYNLNVFTFLAVAPGQ